jgi:TonB-linked SusC/RagA family outer membrane protein
MKRKTFLRQNLVLCALFFFCALTTNLGAQNSKAGSKSIYGVIVDQKGETIIGANVLVKGSKIGTITDIDGKFKLDLPTNSKLTVTYVGYLPQEIVINENSIYKIVLEEDAKKLDEVVVVGYGTVSKRSYTGSASSVKSEDLTALKTISPTQGLQGRASGVNVTTASGMPGAPTKINVRGVNSINAGTSPLWIIDGVPMYSGNGLEASTNSVAQDPMSMINPSDIESMEVLKDAAATAIYGSRGSNGVIMITTKSGKKSDQKGNVNVDYTTGFSDLTLTPQQIGYANTAQWFGLVDKARQNSGLLPFEPNDALSASLLNNAITRDEALQTNSNWFNEVLRTGQYHDINLNLTKGFKGGSVYSSFNYRTDQGVLKNNDLDRITGRINTEFEVIKNLQVGTNIAFSYSHNNRVKTGTAGTVGGGAGTAGAFESANRNALPWLKIYDTVTSENPTGYWYPKAGNIVANNDRRYLQDYVDQYRVVGNAFAELKIAPVKGLSLRSEFGVDYINNSSVNWINSFIAPQSSAVDQNTTRRVINYNAYFKYNNTFGANSFNTVLGTESMRMSGWTRYMSANNLIGSYPELGSSLPGTMINMKSYWSAEDYLRSYFFRTDYRLLDKYVLAVSLRADGSTKFKYDPWGTFTAFSAGWLISEEGFFESLRKTMNQLKIKGSFGQTGNNSVPNDIFDVVITNDPKSYYGGSVSNGTILKSIGNQSITWETTNNYDAGVDFGFLNNRITGSVEYYYKLVSDMILKAALPPSSGITGGNSVYQNIGDMANFGVDFSLTSTNINNKNFKWTTSFNISTNGNKVLSLSPEMNVGGKGVAYTAGTQNVTGQRLGTFFMADYAGIDPDKGVEMIWEIDKVEYKASGKTIKTGRKVAATSANIVENRYLFEDKTIIPTYFGGFNNTFSSHGFDLNVFFTFSGGNYIYDYNLKRASYVHNAQTVLLTDMIGKTWESGKTDATYPYQTWQSDYPNAAWDTQTNDWATATTATNKKDSKFATVSDMHSKFIYKGDFIRLKNLSIGYNLPKNLISKISLENLRFTVQVSNLWTLTSYPGYDPEGASYVDAAGIPNTRTISFGVSAKL